MSRAGKLAKCWGRVTNLTVVRGQGCHVWDTEGKKYLDCAAGIAVVNTGHSHPHVVESIQRQAEKIIHCQVNTHYNDTLLEYTNRLVKHMPPGIDTFFFCNSGAEATEGVVKLARAHTGVAHIVGMHGAFHGRTGAAMALTTSSAKYLSRGYPLPPCFHSIPPPLTDSQVSDAAKFADSFMKGQITWERVAGVIMEPVLGEGGYHPLPQGWFDFLKERCQKGGGLLCYDEVQSGFGRTGKIFAFEDIAAAPDVVMLGKGIAGGMPMAGFAASEEVMNSLSVSSHGGTYGGNPVAAAAAIAVLDVLESDGFMENVRARGEQLRSGLKSLQKLHPELIHDVRGPGLMIGIDFASTDTCLAIKAQSLEKGVLLFSPCGIEGRTMRLMPPLVLTESEANEILQVLSDSLKSIKH